MLKKTIIAVVGWLALGGWAWADITSNRLVHLEFEENTGTATADSSGNANNGTLGNACTWSTSGKIGNCVVIDGDYVHVPVQLATTSIIGASTTFTIAAWVNPSSVSGAHGIWIEQYSGGNEVYFYLNGSQLAFDKFPPSGLGAGGGTVSASAWTHVCVTSNAGSLTLYVNGSSVATASLETYTGGGSLQYVLVGGRYSDNSFAGKIDEFRIYSRALSGAEVTALVAYTGSGGGSTLPRMFLMFGASLTPPRWHKDARFPLVWSFR